MTWESDWRWQWAFRQLAGIMVLTTAMSSLRSQERVGLLPTEPASRPFVKTDHGYMVPFHVTIPGSDVTFEMIPIPGGTIRLQGDQPSRQRGAMPDVEVKIAPFWMGRHEVTWDEYHLYCGLLQPFKRFEQLRVREVTEENKIDSVTAPSVLYTVAEYYPATAAKRHWPRHPAVAMTQYGAKQYTKWLSKLTNDFYRLPSEVEWEYACRAGSTTAYCFGEDSAELAEYAWYLQNSGHDTHPVGLKKPNRWGLYDMHGNVSEWVLDQYSGAHAALQRELSAGKPPIAWPTRLHPRTVRGGSWNSTARDCRSSTRTGSSEDWQEDEAMYPHSPHWLASSWQRQIGFRLVRPLSQPPSSDHKRYWDADVDALREAVDEYVSNGRTARGIVDPKLPNVIEKLPK